MCQASSFVVHVITLTIVMMDWAIAALIQHRSGSEQQEQEMLKQTCSQTSI